MRILSRRKINLLIFALFTCFTLQAEVYAVIVGVSRYEDPEDNLKYAASDAQAFYKVLTSGKQNPNVALLLNEKATEKNILNEMRAKFAKAKASDRIIFFFSGHGINGAFCQYDCGDYTTFLEHEEIQSAFKKSKAKVKICIADACHAGSIRKKGQSKTLPPDTIAGYYKAFNDQSKLKTNNIIVFMSSRGNQYSEEHTELGQGVFTYYLIEAFKGKADTNKDKKVTAKEMYTYVRNKVSSGTGKSQVPVMFGRFSENTVIVAYK